MIVINLRSVLYGGRNTFVGYESGLKTSTSDSTYVGSQAGLFEDNGYKNIYLGSNAGPPNVIPAHPGLGRILVGANATTAGTPSVPWCGNDIGLGFQSTIESCNQIKLGNTALKSFRVGSVASWSTPSDRRLKSDITEAVRGLSFIHRLQPVQYRFQGSKALRTGFIAQEVEKADPLFPGVVKPDHPQNFYALEYDAFIPALVKSVQELNGNLNRMQPPPARGNDLAHLKWIVLWWVLTGVCFGLCMTMQWKISAHMRPPKRR